MTRGIVTWIFPGLPSRASRPESLSTLLCAQSASSTAFQAVPLLRFAEEDWRLILLCEAEEGDRAKRGGGGSTGCDR